MLKSHQNNVDANGNPRQRFGMNRQATSIWQLSEWGMRCLQGSFPRIIDKMGSLSIPRSVDSISALASACCSILRKICLAYLTSAGHVGSPVGFLTLCSCENFRRSEGPVRSLSGKFSLCCDATTSHSWDPIGRWVEMVSSNERISLILNCWPRGAYQDYQIWSTQTQILGLWVQRFVL